MILNSTFKDVVVVNADEQFDGCSFESGSVDKAKGVFGLTVAGDANVEVKHCSFTNKGYSAIYMNSTGTVEVENCKMDCTGLYNPIEGSGEVAIGNTSIKDVIFENCPGNNCVNFYNVQDGSKHNVAECKALGLDCDKNFIRLSNFSNHSAEFEVKDCAYKYVSGEPSDYTACCLCQDNTNKNGVKQDFTKYSITFDNIECNGEKIVEKPVVGSLVYVYENGRGVITEEGNIPTIVIK